MAEYKCFKCGTPVKSEDLSKRFVCHQCGGKIFYKPRTRSKKIKSE